MRKSYIERTKAFTLNNKAIKALKKASTKARQSRNLSRDGTSSGDNRRCAKTQKE